ncbi:MAG TPA: hypothetical protein VGX03_12405 [Candidatus Binatia bacterium]|jgi:hypothetical protein|nr:hypothetical protein [Candidatus Binatia bacterium]
MISQSKSMFLTVFAFAVLLIGACTDSTVTKPAEPGAPTQTDVALLSRGGFRVQELRMRELLRQVTLEAAVALADAQLRAEVFAALHSSPYREHKLHFASLLRGDGRHLLSAIASHRAALSAAVTPRGQSAQEAVLATLDSIVDLEFYMPVKDHFAAWEGGSNLIVASSLRDDGRVPDGFDLAGRAVTLSAAYPPATPALVLVPVETDFSRVTPAAPSGVDAVSANIAGIYMTRAVIYSDYEGWPNGNPEFEVHLFQTDVDMEYIDQVCAGEHQGAPYQWNTQETQDWSGEVLVATEGRLALSPNNQFQMWEDDADYCTATTGMPPRGAGDPRTELMNWASAVLGIVASGGTVSTVQAIFNAIPAYYALLDDGDDEVGVITLPGACYPTAPGPINFRINSSASGHPETGWVTLEYRFGGTGEPLCPLSVWIDGESFVYAGSVATWTAQPANGTPAYAYQWYVNGSPTGTGQSYSEQVGGVDFELSVTVTDAVGTTASAAISVTVSSCPPPQISC